MKPLIVHKQRSCRMLSSALAAVLILSSAGSAQTTAFIYQGRLSDAGNPANGNYDMQFLVV